jgi:uncharacterized protein YcnI
MNVHPVRRRRTLIASAATLGALVAAPAAFGHASISPAVVKAKTGQYFTLAVPTEKEGAETTKIELTPPAGFAIDSFEAAPGWKREVQASGSGEETTIQKVTWSGGKTPTEEDSVFHFVASADSAKTYTFNVRQTYSDGSVVDWNGPESSDTPAPTIEVESSIGGGGGSNTLAIVAIVVAALALVVGGVGLVGGGGRRPLT